MIVPVLVISFLLGSLLSVCALAARFRLLGVEKAALPHQPAETLVLPGSRYPRWLRLLSFAGLFSLLGALSIALAPAPPWRPAPFVVLAVAAAVFLLHVYVDTQSVSRLELDGEGFQLGEKKSARRVKWIHLTELRNDRDLIRFRVNRALVRGAHWRYWDGAIRNRWGVDTRQLLRLLERYREQAMETAPDYLTGRAAKSRS